VHIPHQYRGQGHIAISKAALLVIVALFIPGWAALGQTSSEPVAPVPQLPAESDTHMSETLRSSVGKVVVVGAESPPSEEISGSYQKDTAGLIAGASEGSRLGTISQEIGGININYPIPILTIPGAIYGGLSGATKREIQEFRDALTEELADAESKPLTNDGLALDVYQELGKLSGLQTKLFAPTTPIPPDTDAVLFVSFDDIGIDVEGKEAELSVSAKATLRDASDGLKLYETVVRYQDRDTLGNWTENENALWRDYANFAAHYLAREISAVLFDRIEVGHELRPKESDDVSRVKKNDWRGVSKSTRPTLLWESIVTDQSKSPLAASLDESHIYYDVEIYTLHRLVYSQKQVPEPMHTLGFDIQDCETYRWSVRPSYHVDGNIKYGEWMRFEPDANNETTTPTGNGNVGRKASEAPAYIQDFATLQIKCGRR